jgi:prefoldin subunit 5
MINKANEDMNELNILVFDNMYADDEEGKIIKSKDVICPKCGELCLINFDECKVKLNSCKNKDEQLISLDEFIKTQLVNENKILCDICNKSNKGSTTEEKFWICGTCNKKICLLCKSAHDKDHILIEYNKKNYVCHKHNEPLKSYCEACQLNLCEKCNTEHDKDHKIISFEEIMPNIENVEKNLKELKKVIDTFNDQISEMLKMLNQVKNNMNIYYTINDNLLKNYDNKNRNYKVLVNLNIINNDSLAKDLNDIISEKDLCKKFSKINEIYEKLKKNEAVNQNSGNNNALNPGTGDDKGATSKQPDAGKSNATSAGGS